MTACLVGPGENTPNRIGVRMFRDEVLPFEIRASPGRAAKIFGT